MQYPAVVNGLDFRELIFVADSYLVTSLIGVPFSEVQ